MVFERIFLRRQFSDDLYVKEKEKQRLAVSCIVSHKGERRARPPLSRSCLSFFFILLLRYSFVRG